MSAIFVDVSKAVPRPYCPLDAEVFTPEQWNTITERFQQGIDEKRYTKLPYDIWRGLAHNKDYAYRIVSFICNSTNYNAYKVSIKTYNFDPNDPYVFVNDKREYVLGASDSSLGEYLKKVYFNCNFKFAEVDTTDLPDVNSWEYMGPKYFGQYPPPKDKLTDLAWCALYQKRPWIPGIGNDSVTYGLAIAGMETKMIMGEIEKPDWGKTLCYKNVNVKPIDKNKTFINDALIFDQAIKNHMEGDRVYYKSDAYDKWNTFDTADTADTTSVKYDTSTATDSLISTATSSSLNWIPPSSIMAVNVASTEQVDKLTKRVENIENTINKKEKKEDNKMKMFNFDFGPIKDNDAIRMSPYGLAVKNVNGTYQAYDKKNGEIMDVDIFNFKADNMFFKMPVGIDAIEAGDVIIFNRRPCFVFGFSEQGDVIAIDIAMGEKKTIMPTKSPFGNFSFITKIVSLFDNMMAPPSKDNPLGNMWMFTLLDDNNKSMKDMLPMMMLMNGNAGGTMDPMMLYFMMKDGKGENDSMLPFLLMMNKK